MPALTITAARADLLRAVADPDTDVYATILGRWDKAIVWLRPPGSRPQKVTSAIAPLEAAGLVKRNPVGVRHHDDRHYLGAADGGRVTRTAQAAERDGLIELQPRKPGDEHRGQPYKLTDAGEKALAEHDARQPAERK